MKTSDLNENSLPVVTLKFPENYAEECQPAVEALIRLSASLERSVVNTRTLVRDLQQIDGTGLQEYISGVDHADDENPERYHGIAGEISSLEQVAKRAYRIDDELRSALRETFNSCLQMLSVASLLRESLDLDSNNVNGENAAQGFDLVFRFADIEIAQDDCREERIAYAEAWWDVWHIEMLLQFWINVQAGFQAAQNDLIARRDAITAAALNPPPPPPGMTPAQAASARARELRRIGALRPRVDAGLASARQMVNTMTTSLATLRSTLAQALQALRDCENAGSF